MKNIAIAFSLLALTLAGCNTPQTTTSEVDGDRKLRSVSVTVGNLSNPFFVVMGQGVEQEAKKIGGENVKFTVVRQIIVG